ncbi:major facilitator superfamily protein [Trichoderma chlorosporum]
MPAASGHSETVPGTVHLIDLAGTTAEGTVELVPRPSDDPEDPLNWSRRRKYLAMTMVIVYTVGTGIPGTLQSSMLADITHETGISTADLVQGTGVMFLFLGWSCLITQPLALTYGRRGVYLMSTLFTVPLMIWTAYSTSAGEWYAHRILFGMVNSPIEALPEVSIPDIFFAHERGAWMSVYVLALFGTTFLSPVIAGFFAEAYGWRWTMRFGAIIAATAFVILFFFMEETMYFRSTLEGLEDESRHISENATEPRTSTEEKKTDSSTATDDNIGTTYRKRNYIEKLKPFVRTEGRPTKSQMFKSMVLPLTILVQFPSIAWAGFIYGLCISWNLVLTATISPIMSSPPYNWSTGAVGLIYLGPLIGAALGSIWAGYIADRLTLMLARRNKGVREPEHRLWPLALSGVLSCIGLIIWGVGTAHNIHWPGLAVGLGILTYSTVASGSIVLSYNVDCFKDMSGESTVSMIILRNTLGFAVSYGITPWYRNMGLQNCFIMAGFLSLGCTSTFLFMIWKGKSLRRRCAERYWNYARKGIHAAH